MARALPPGKRRFNRGFDKAFDICLDPGALKHEVLRNLEDHHGAGRDSADEHCS